ncbi:PaaI family thioesterase [Actinomadura sp. LOL_016]|uniref:PaaI family thioesterase n=1 Tax=unclassified Actinomadura TaxID=2626254 RepID=UPI003481CC89
MSTGGSEPRTPNLRWAGSDFQDPPRTDGGVALCGACRTAGSCRLGVERERLDEAGTAWFDVSCPRDQEGGPNVAHGGWTASVLDECLGHVPLLNSTLSVTAELSVSFVKPVPIERPIRVKAWVEKREGSRWYIAGEMTLLPSGAVLARASGIWVTRDPGHFDRHERWLAELDTPAP